MQDTLNIHQFYLNHFQRRDLSKINITMQMETGFCSVRRHKGPRAFSVTGKLFAVGQTSCLTQVIYSSSGHVVETEVQDETLCAVKMNCNDFFFICMGQRMCFSMKKSRIICSMCAEVSAKPLDSSKPNWRTKQTFTLRGEKKDKLFQERRHRCSILKTKRIGRNSPLADD